MKRSIGLLFVAVVTILILLFFSNPELLDKAWLWMVGLAGYILALFESGLKSVAKIFKSRTEPDGTNQVEPGPMPLNHNIQSQIEKIDQRIQQIERRIAADKDFPTNQQRH